MELGAYTEDLKRLKLPLPPQARRMPGGTYLSSFLERRPTAPSGAVSCSR